MVRQKNPLGSGLGPPVGRRLSSGARSRIEYRVSPCQAGPTVPCGSGLPGGRAPTSPEPCRAPVWEHPSVALSTACARRVAVMGRGGVPAAARYNPLSRNGERAGPVRLRVADTATPLRPPPPAAVEL